MESGLACVCRTAVLLMIGETGTGSPCVSWNRREAYAWKTGQERIRTNMEASKENMIWKQLCSRLSGDRILIPDLPNETKQMVLCGLQRVNEWTGAGFEISEQAELMRSEDYVLLFPEFGVRDSLVWSENRVKSDRKTIPENKSQMESVKENENDSWHGFLCFTEQIEQIRKIRPESVLLLSDTSVYGKIFGTPHALKEEETGYVCHTDSKDMNVQCMRMAEHVCGRLAREEGIRIKTARIDRRALAEIKNSRNDREESLTDGKMEERLAEAILRVLLDGVPGEVYNLPVMPDRTGGEEGHSALSPIRIVPDCGKAGRL